MATLLLFDVNYLAYRSFYAHPGLSVGDVGTSVVFGAFRAMLRARQQYGDDAVPVCCFDFGKNKRKAIYPGYKASRDEMTEEQQEKRNEIRKQLDVLRTDYLPAAGFHNILFQKGYEADDCVASVALAAPDEDTSIIVSADQDLYQLLGPRVLMAAPGSEKCYTMEQFTADWGIKPKDWAKVKAIAGCSGDDVVGVPGVGEKTAAKYLRGEMKKDSAKYKAIRASKEICLANYRVVRLPFEGVDDFEIDYRPFDLPAIQRLAERLHMTTLFR